MARHDVYRSPDGRGYLIDVQTDLLDGLNTRVVVPLLPLDVAPRPAKGLNPMMDVADVPHMMATQYVASIPSSLLRAPVTSLSARADEVTRALDVLFQGF